jgi:peptide-methionine (S)-S-oxide reductase
MMHSSDNLAVATLGGGCFWCLEAVFDELEGVADVVSGYAGGDVENPTYRAVCTGRTGHAEVVQLKFDPAAVSFADVLRVFFAIHDPTTLNRQGADTGTQYRSVIFYHDDAQLADARAIIAEIEAEGVWPGKLVTQLAPFTIFYPAEDYHQEYFRRNPYQGYCQAVVAPKVAKFRQKFAGRMKKSAAWS